MARQITFLWHGNAHELYEGAPDKLRRLSRKGRDQARERREQLGNPKFDLIICSQVIRTTETALEVAGKDNIAPVVMLYELFTPHSGPVHDALERLFQKLGHQSLSAYYADDPADVKQMRRFGRIGWEIIISKIANTVISNSDYRVLVVGHDICLACMVNSSYPDETSECLMDLIQGECDGFVVKLDECDDVVSISLLPPLE